MILVVAEQRNGKLNRAVGAPRQRLANHLLDPRRPGRADDHFPAMLLAEPQRLLQRIGVRLVHLVADVLLADPRLVVGKPRLPLAGGDLLDANSYLHESVRLSLSRNTEAQRTIFTRAGTGPAATAIV